MMCCTAHLGHDRVPGLLQQRAHPVPYRGQSAGRIARGRELLSLTAGVGIHLQMTLGKQNGLEIIACASTEGKHTQSLVHNTQQGGWMDGRMLAAHKRLKRNLICFKLNQFKEPFAPLSFRTRHVSHTYISFFLSILGRCVYLK